MKVIGQDTAALILVLLAGGTEILRDLFLLLATGSLPERVSCLTHACL